MMLAFMLVLGPPAHSASVLTVSPYTAANVPTASVTQADVRAGMYTQNVEVQNGAFFRAIYNYRIRAFDGETAQPLSQLTNVVFTVGANTTGSTNSIVANAMLFNSEPNAPVWRAYDINGVDVTVSANLLGKALTTSLVNLGIYEIVGTGWGIQTTPSATFGGAYTVNSVGDEQYGTLAVQATVDNSALSATGMGTTTIVPEPSSLLMLLGLVGVAARRRR